MTNETKAPEQIWLELDGEDFIFHCNPDPQMIYALKTTDSAFAYVPENLSDTQAARIAELEAEQDKLQAPSEQAVLDAISYWKARAEVAEAKLARAEISLTYMVRSAEQLEENDNIFWEATNIARATLAELKGGE